MAIKVTKKTVKAVSKKAVKTVTKITKKPVVKKTPIKAKTVTKKAVKPVAKKPVKTVPKKAVKTVAKVTKKPEAKKASTKTIVKAKVAVKKEVVKVEPKKVVKPVKVEKRILTKSEKILEMKSAELMRLGRERGYVTYDELLRSFPEIEKDIEFLDVLYDRFSIAGIDVLQSGGMLGDDPSIEIIAQKNAFKRSDSSYDSIQMYLREIGL